MRAAQFIARKRLHQPARLSVMVFTLFLASCGFFENKSEYQQLQDKYQRLSDQIAALGGSAKRETAHREGMSMTGWFIDLSNAEITDDLVESMVDYARNDPVFDLNLSNSTITDEQLVQLDQGKVLQKCFFLNLSNTPLTDAGLDQCSNYHVIHELDVTGSKITQDAVDRLGDKQLAKDNVPEAFKVRPNVKI